MEVLKQALLADGWVLLAESSRKDLYDVFQDEGPEGDEDYGLHFKRGSEILSLTVMSSGLLRLTLY